MFDKFYVAAASGVESVVKKELTRLNYEPGGAEYGLIPVTGGIPDAVKLNMALRTANRVYMCVAEGMCDTFDALYEFVRAVPFEDFLPSDARVVVNAKSHRSALFALSAVQRVVKRAVCDRMGGTMSESGTTYPLLCVLNENRALLMLDTTGESLHKRGYRTYVGDAPIRETLAAALLLLAGYRGGVLIDPFSGSGTIPIEAAMIATDTAPGLNRAFAFENFGMFSAKTVRDVRESLTAEIKTDAKPEICGYDIDPKACETALRHLSAAGLEGKVHFQRRDVKELSSRFNSGHIVTNPPYGIRLGTDKELKKLYRCLSERYAAMRGFTLGVITAYPFFEKDFGRRPDRKRKLYNSEIESVYYIFNAQNKAR